MQKYLKMQNTLRNEEHHRYHYAQKQLKHFQSKYFFELQISQLCFIEKIDEEIL